MFSKIRSQLRRQKQKRTFRKANICIAHDVEFYNIEFGQYVNLAHHCQISNTKIGARTSVGRYAKIQFADIGKYCSISWDVTIGALEHPLHAVSTHAFSYRKQFGLCAQDLQLPHESVVIENDVWIGCGAIIMPGVHIGDGAVIGAGGVVTHDVEPYEIVAGCPARHVSWRFSLDKRQQLKEIKWWDWPDEKIKKNFSFFHFRTNVQDANEDILKEMLVISKQ